MSDYKRFTEKRNGKNVIPLRNAVCGVGLPKWSIEKHSDIQSFLMGDAVDCFAELEDKIEQGTLIELPCKVGDDVYFVVQHEEDWVMEIGYVISISIDKEGIWISCRYSSGLSYWHNLKDSDVFFNANKANEKLKELQE